MKKYLSFFRLRFLMGLQYRTAALAGIVTQFAWGGMEILVYKAFYEADANAFPMSFSATASYIWMQQAFLAFFAAMQNVALRLYSGSMSNEAMLKAMLLQLFWLFTLTVLGKKLCNIAEKRITVQGG